jgi:hypothetical protein
MKREYLGAAMVVFVLGYGLLIYWAAWISGTALAWTILVVVSVAIAVFFALVLARRDRRYATTIELAPRPADGVYRVLVIADAAGTSASFRQSLLDAAAGRPIQALVVAPAISSRLDRWTGDQSAYDDASTRLHETISGLDSIGVDARGHIGSHDPLQAVAEALREFPADWIVFATHPADQAKWLEGGVVAEAGSRTDIPVSHVVVG